MLYWGYIHSVPTHKEVILFDGFKSFEVIFEVLLKVSYTSLNEEMEDTAGGRQ